MRMHEKIEDDILSENEKSENGNKIGILLVNLGTPEGTDFWSMRKYLKEFLWDPRVVEVPRLIWWFVLNGIILTFRPALSGKAYAKIWNREKDESPLRTITRDTADKLKARFADTMEGDQVEMIWGMRYGKPSIRHGLRILQEKKGCEKILVVPLYPQYSASTTASVVDECNRVLKNLRHQPNLRFVPPYYDDAAYIKALGESFEKSVQELDFEPEVILMSFHGIPVRYVTKGDPYQRHCEVTADLLREATGRDASQLRLTYQSRLGREPWLSPYTDKTLEELARKGTKNIAVITPGFAADCVETLEEIALEGKEIFLENGGEKFALLPSLNDSDPAMRLLEYLVIKNMRDW